MKPLQQCRDEEWVDELRSGYGLLEAKPFTVRALATTLETSAKELAKRYTGCGLFPESLVDAWRGGVKQREIHTLLNTGRTPILQRAAVARGRTTPLLFSLDEAVVVSIIWRFGHLYPLGPLLRDAMARALTPAVVREVAQEGKNLRLVLVPPNVTVIPEAEFIVLDWWAGVASFRLPAFVYDAVRAFLLADGAGGR